MDRDTTFVAFWPQTPLSTSFATVLTLFTPSPGANAIPITVQSQIVTHYVPQFTAYPLSVSGLEPLYGKRSPTAIASASTAAVSGITGLPLTPICNLSGCPNRPTAIGPETFNPTPVSVHTITPSGISITTFPFSSSTAVCSTYYSPTITAICATILTPLGGIPIPVTACDQEIAFSTGLGLYLAPGSPSSTLLPTTYSAPWDSVVTGVPLAPVLAVYCPDGVENACETETQSWYTEMVETLVTATSTLSLSTIVSGPSKIFIPPLFSTAIPDHSTTQLSISTTYGLASTTAIAAIVQKTYSTTLLLPSPTSAPTTFPSSDSVTTTLTSTSTQFTTEFVSQHAA
ncbi:hypothetical protein MMC25_001851 [Agyrium rufum]|nr:hypothetical protein [Agyrium rufum]